MLRRWQVWGGVCVFFAVIAEAVNILADEYQFVQWVLFIVSVVAFIVAITAWDRSRQRHRTKPD